MTKKSGYVSMIGVVKMRGLTLMRCPEKTKFPWDFSPSENGRDNEQQEQDELKTEKEKDLEKQLVQKNAELGKLTEQLTKYDKGGKSNPNSKSEETSRRVVILIVLGTTAISGVIGYFLGWKNTKNSIINKKRK